MGLQILPMTKTQIQVPEELLDEVRAFAKRREWSLAETFRRGAELLMEVYPAPAGKTSVPWNRVGWKGLSAKQLREAAFADQDPRLS